MSKIENIPGLNACAIARRFNLDLPPPEFDPELGPYLLEMYDAWNLISNYQANVHARDMTVRQAIGRTGIMRLEAIDARKAWLGPCILTNGVLLHGVGIWEPRE